MKEFIGSCSNCGKQIFCMDGFLNGVHTKDGRVLCFDCDESEKEKHDPS